MRLIDIEDSLNPNSVPITDSNNKLGYRKKEDIINAKRAFGTSSNLQPTSNDDVLITDSIFHTGKVNIGADFITLPENVNYNHQIQGNQRVVGINNTEITLNQLNKSYNVFIAIDVINGDDTIDDSQFNYSTTAPLTSTSPRLFKTFEKAIDWCNANTAYYYYITLFNTTITNQLVFNANRVINGKYITLYNGGGTNYLTFNGRLDSSGELQISGLTLTLNGNGKLTSDYGEVQLINCNISLVSTFTYFFNNMNGNFYIVGCTFNFSANNQSLFRASGSYGSTLSIGNTTVTTFNLNSFTGCRLYELAYIGYNTHTRCFRNTLFPAGLNIQGGVFQYGETNVYGQQIFDATNINYKVVAHSTTPIRTPDMNSGTANAIGVFKNVVVDATGVFKVSDATYDNIRSTAVATTITANDGTIVFTARGLTQALPTSVNRQVINLKNNSTGNLTITGNIDGVVTTLIIATTNSITLHGNGTTWFKI
jgi:hypothetical protein